MEKLIFYCPFLYLLCKKHGSKIEVMNTFRDRLLFLLGFGLSVAAALIYWILSYLILFIFKNELLIVGIPSFYLILLIAIFMAVICYWIIAKRINNTYQIIFAKIVFAKAIIYQFRSERAGYPMYIYYEWVYGKWDELVDLIQGRKESI